MGENLFSGFFNKDIPVTTDPVESEVSDEPEEKLTGFEEGLVEFRGEFAEVEGSLVGESQGQQIWMIEETGYDPNNTSLLTTNDIARFKLGLMEQGGAISDQLVVPGYSGTAAGVIFTVKSGKSGDTKTSS